MKRFVLAMLLLGTVLLGVVVHRTDLHEVWDQLSRIDPGSAVAILLTFLVAHVALAASWLVTLPGLSVTPRWLFRIWRVLMVGSALESVTPLAALGGDPVKAILLKRHYGVRFTDATASLVLARMTDLLAQVLFISIGLVLMFQTGVLPTPYRIAGAAGLIVFAVVIALFLLVQTRRGFSRLRGWLERGPLGARLSLRVVTALDAVHEVEDRLVAFYSSRRPRLLLSVAGAFAEWTGNAVAVYLVVNALGQPIGFTDALVIEAFVALVRSTFFFVPGDVGTQEAALVLICGAITGSPATGLALATVRRARDLLWVLTGLAIGGAYSIRREVTLEAIAEATAAERSEGGA